jgi:hypothetical protein
MGIVVCATDPPPRVDSKLVDPTSIVDRLSAR